MRLLDLTLPSPAENLACEEALLDAYEENGGNEILRFWESSETFVVVGYGNKVATEANVAACRMHGIPILRRCSGGGTVLQGVGCLNYALILRITEDGPLRSITSANQFIMERNRAAIGSLLPSQQITVRGHTDLTLGELKFSGNSQRRKKSSVLFHGTFLLNFDLRLVSELLRMPTSEPDYRARRRHEHFLINLNQPAENVKTAMRRAWNVTGEPKDYPRAETRQLAAQKYSTDEWNFKF